MPGPPALLGRKVCSDVMQNFIIDYSEITHRVGEEYNKRYRKEMSDTNRSSDSIVSYRD